MLSMFACFEERKCGRLCPCIASNQQRNSAPYCIVSQQSDCDTTALLRAIETDDIQRLVQMLTSNKEISCVIDHPWAETPNTVGALALARLGLLSEKTGNDDRKKAIYQAGVVPHLLKFLRSHEQDRVEHSCLAISFLTEDPEIATYCFDAGAFVHLMCQSDHPKWQMRAIAAATVRNMFLAQTSFRADFAKLGGIDYLVDCLITSAHCALSDEEHAELLDEVVLNLHDFVQPADAPICEEFARKVIEFGALQVLRKLQSHRNRDVRKSATELFNVLQESCPNAELRARSFVVLTLKAAEESCDDGIMQLSFQGTGEDSSAIYRVASQKFRLTTTSEVYKQLEDQMKLPKSQCVKVLLPGGGLLPAASRPLEHYLTELLAFKV